MNNASLIRYAIRNIRPNPFRNLQRYPIQREKVDALRESLRATEYWPNIVARRIDGGAEIAYGHHRIEAVRQEFSDDYEIGLVIRDLSDETMFQMMARENREEWSTGFDFEIELVRATVEAFAAGRLQLGLPDERTPHAALRLAPSFKCGADVSPAAWNRSYTAASIAGYLRLTKSNGDAQDKVHHALSALELIELGLAQQTDFAGLSIKGAGELISKARQARAIAGRRAESARKEAEYRKGKAADAIEKKQMAEADLRKQTQRLAEAQTERDKYNAERDAKDAARRIKQAEITRQLAQEDAYNAGVKEQEQLEKTRTAPAAIVQTIGEKLKSGEIGYRGVKEEAEKLTRTKPQRRRLSVRNLIQRLNLIFDEKRDERVKNLQRLLVGDRLSPGQRQALIDALRAVKDRVTKYELLLQLLDTNDVKIDEWGESGDDEPSQQILAPPQKRLPALRSNGGTAVRRE